MLRHDGYLEVVSIACGMVAGTTLLSIGAASTRSIDLTSNKLISRGINRLTSVERSVREGPSSAH
ncbi:conserved hypothetical protein [Ricinus communis]|uniref:Uncharacterized protein n=1 Tax=Ricinus communis TaxID=3988 RepID=B9RDX1_RICCO|nr:conserved hypothetical protein [Ricinus communis]